MNEVQAYLVTQGSWIAGRWRETGETVRLTSAQARYEHVTLAATSSILRRHPKAPRQKGGEK